MTTTAGKFGIQMYVWRIPILLFAPLVTATLLLVVCTGLLTLRRSLSTRAGRALMLALIGIALLTSPTIVWAIIESSAEREPEMMRKYIDPSIVTLWSASFVATILLVLAHRLFPCVSVPITVCVRYRASFFSVAFAFAVLNVTNWCSPGWCERFGFPLPYSWWSDAIIIMNGKNLTAGTSIAAFVANLAALALVPYAMSRKYQGIVRSA